MENLQATFQEVIETGAVKEPLDLQKLLDLTYLLR